MLWCQFRIVKSLVINNGLAFGEYGFASTIILINFQASQQTIASHSTKELVEEKSITQKL